LTKSTQFEIISRGSILQNYSHKPDIFSELQKCDNSEIKQFVNKYENNGYNYKKNPNFVVTVIREEFPETLEYYKIQLFLSQLFKDLADQTNIIKKKESYKKYSDKYLKKGKNTEKICVSALHVSNQVEDIHENTDEKIIECEKYYHKYEDPNFLLTKGNLESINNTEDAIKTFKEGTQKFENDKRFNNNLANMYMSIEEFDTAKKYYTNIDKISSLDNLQEEEIFWNNIGCMYSQINEIEKAEFYFNKAIRKNPKNFMAWYNGGIHKMLSGDTAGAEKNLKKSYNLNKNHHLTGINYAQALIKNGNKEKARGIFKKISPYQDQQTELSQDVRNSLENNRNNDPVKNIREKLDKWEVNPQVFKKKLPLEIKESIEQEMEQILDNWKEKDAQLFQRVVTAMQQHDTSASKVLSNELAALRRKEKLMGNNWLVISALKFTPKDILNLVGNQKKCLALVKQIRNIACIQKLMGEKSIYDSLVILHNKIIQCTEDNFFESSPKDRNDLVKWFKTKIKNNLESKELIKIANHKLKLNEKDTNTIEMMIFAYYDLDEMTNATKYAKKLAKIEPENKNSLVNKIVLDKKMQVANYKEFSKLLSFLEFVRLKNELFSLKEENHSEIL